MDSAGVIMKTRPDKKSGSGRPCLWMQAGVVSKKYCRFDYHCAICRYDKVMRTIARENREAKEAGVFLAGNRGKIVSWKDKLRLLPLSKRPCVHHMKGHITFRICNKDYHCGKCDFDQFFEEQYCIHTVLSPVEAVQVKGFTVPQGYYFHYGHAWAKIEKDAYVRVGVDDFALRLFGPFDRIETPLLGGKVRQSQPHIRFARGRLSAEMLSPISGTVTAVNSRLREDGRLAGSAPYSEGWVMMVKPDALRVELKELMIQDETKQFISGQVDLLYKEIDAAAGIVAADGGYLSDDIFGHLPDADWKHLTRIFLQT